MVFPSKIKDNKKIYGRKHIALNKELEKKYFMKKLEVMQRLCRDVGDKEFIELLLNKFDINKIDDKS